MDCPRAKVWTAGMILLEPQARAISFRRSMSWPDGCDLGNILHTSYPDLFMYYMYIRKTQYDSLNAHVTFKKASWSPKFDNVLSLSE